MAGELADHFSDQFETENTPASILLYGITPKQHEGFLVVLWTPTVPKEVRQDLLNNSEIKDMVIYDVPSDSDQQQKEQG